MSVLIKGMEMPKDGELLCINIHPDGKVCINLDLECEKVGEAVPVPPHGRLIDADATRVSFVYSEGTGDWSVPQMRTVLEIIDAAPTIIPASEEGNT